MAAVSPLRLKLRFPDRVAYVVSHSAPYSSNGYAVRTHEVAKALGSLGHDVLVINRPGRPWDIEGFPADEIVQSEQIIDGVRYIFLPSRATFEDRQSVRLKEAETLLLEAFEVFRPGMVLAVSNWENAEPAQNAARKYGCEFFYEQRGFWEMSRSALPGQQEADDQAARDRQREVRIARGARAVFTLNSAMRDELVASGVPEGKIRLVPNGVGQPCKTGARIGRADLGITAKYVIGYIGSLSAYEGVEDILHLLAHLRGEGVDVAAMIVGSCAPKGLITAKTDDPARDKLKDLAQSLSLEHHVHFVPQVPPDQTGAYYDIADAIVLPRRRMAMTELVAPLKPYAAAAHKVPVFMTDMPPLDEVAKDINASLFPEGDIPALAAMVRAAFENGHPARSAPLCDSVAWSHRVRPMSRLLAAEACNMQRKLHSSRGNGALSGGPVMNKARFDLECIPRVALAVGAGVGSVVRIGPKDKRDDAEAVTYASRQTLFAALGAQAPGLFVIDWAGIQTEPNSEWNGLWSISNMRLNRQIMDACRIALDRGWTIRVLGPVVRGQAPFYQTVAGCVEEECNETRSGASDGTDR